MNYGAEVGEATFSDRLGLTAGQNWSPFLTFVMSLFYVDKKTDECCSCSDVVGSDRCCTR